MTAGISPKAGILHKYNISRVFYKMIHSEINKFRNNNELFEVTLIRWLLITVQIPCLKMKNKNKK